MVCLILNVAAKLSQHETDDTRSFGIFFGSVFLWCFNIHDVFCFCNLEFEKSVKAQRYQSLFQ
jgi:hypothetical protein